MRNLKRVLSLAMASVMLLGMMVIGAGAANKKALSDLDKVTNKEAVNLMVDLGIIVGKPDGSFAPTETIDRATMSKLIYFIMMGTADESAFKGVSTPLTDVKGNWAEGFINYCYSVNIVAGTGDNTYNPNGKVTTVSAAKMLLVALGYDPVASKYQNDAMWSVNIMRDAQSAGLLEKVTQKASEELTRDSAAQMIFNALFAATVKPSFQIDMGIKYLSGYNKILDTHGNVVTLAKSNYNLTKYTGVVVANEYAGVYSGTSALDAGKTTIYFYSTVDDATKGNVVSNGAKTIDVATDISLLGQEVVYYTHGKDNKTTSFVTATGKTKEYTWTDDTITYAKFLTNNSLTDTNAQKALNYVYNASMTVAVEDGTRFVDSNADGKIDFVLKTAYTFSKVTKIDSTNVTITGLGTRKIADVSGSADLEKDDYVNYAVVGTSGKAAVEKAAEVEGTVSALKSNKTKIVVNGTTYDVVDEGRAILEDPAKAADDYANDLDLSKAVAGIFYLTKDGKVAVYFPTEDAAATTVLYAYVTALNVTTSFGKKTVDAKVVLADGTQQTFNVVDNSSSTTTGLYDTAVAAATPAALDALAGVYPYTVNKDGKMVAGVKVTNVTNLTDGAYTAGKPVMAVTDGGTPSPTTGNVLLDSNTVVLFYDKDGDKETISSVKGVDNVPGIAGAKSVTYVVESGKTFASFILVEAVGQTATADYAYALGNSYASQTAEGYVYNMVVDGAKITLTTKDEQNDMHTGNIYTYGVDKDGIATLSLVNASNIFFGKVASVSSKYVTLKSGTAVEFASDYSVDDLTATDSKNAVIPAIGSLSKDANIFYVVSGSKLVKAYIINDGKAATYESGNANQGASFAFDGYNITVSGTLSAASANKLALKFSTPAGVAGDGATVTVATATTVAGLGNGSPVASPDFNTAETTLQLEETLSASVKAIKVVITWNAEYAETYIIDATGVTLS